MNTNRRSLLAALPALLAAPVMVKGQEVGKAFKIEPNAKYLVFVNDQMIDAQDLVRDDALPAGTWIHSVRVYGEQSLDDAIRIYKAE